MLFIPSWVKKRSSGPFPGSCLYHCSPLKPLTLWLQLRLETAPFLGSQGLRTLLHLVFSTQPCSGEQRNNTKLSFQQCLKSQHKAWDEQCRDSSLSPPCLWKNVPISSHLLTGNLHPSWSHKTVNAHSSMFSILPPHSWCSFNDSKSSPLRGCTCVLVFL